MFPSLCCKGAGDRDAGSASRRICFAGQTVLVCSTITRRQYWHCRLFAGRAGIYSVGRLRPPTADIRVRDWRAFGLLPGHIRGAAATHRRLCNLALPGGGFALPHPLRAEQTFWKRHKAVRGAEIEWYGSTTTPKNETPGLIAGQDDRGFPRTGVRTETPREHCHRPFR